MKYITIILFDNLAHKNSKNTKIISIGIISKRKKMSSQILTKEIEDARKKFAEMYGDVKLGGKGKK